MTGEERGPKVLFVVGKGRSGSTLLDVVLGEADGVFSLGEVWVWQGRERLDEQVCGCGVRVGDCPVWRDALTRTRDLWPREYGPPPGPVEVARWGAEVARWGALPRALAVREGELTKWPALEAWSRFASCLYRSLAEVTGARVLVDSSKWPGNPGPLGLVPGIEAHVLHLVRDPRAVAHSWTRVKEWAPGGERMPRFRAGYSSLSWIARNLLADHVSGRGGGPSPRVRYEDLVARPRETVARILLALGESPASDPIHGDGSVHLGVNHTAMGNPVRFKRGEVELRPDEIWRRAQRPWERIVVTGLTFPLLRRYGYPLRAAPREGSGS